MPNLCIVTHSNWMFEEASAGLKDSPVTVSHSYALDVPNFSNKDMFWIPQAQAYKFNKSLEYAGLPDLGLMAPSNTLLLSLPHNIVGREISVYSANDAASVLLPHNTSWWKMVDAKHELFEAKYRTHEELCKDIEIAGLPHDSSLLQSENIENVVAEYRIFTLNNPNFETLQPIAGSIYLEDEKTFYDGAQTKTHILQKCYNFVEKSLTPYSNHLPPSFVVDIAVLEDGSLLVLEFNPVWCSAWYGADLLGVLECLKVSRTNKQTPHKWVPDSIYKQKFSSVRPLQIMQK